MAIQGRPRKQWERGKYIVYFDRAIIGEANIGGLAGVSADSIDELDMAGPVRGEGVALWLQGWKLGETRTIIVRDNPSNRWLTLEAWKQEEALGGPGLRQHVIVNSAQEIDPPEWIEDC